MPLADTRTATTTTRYIARCIRKGCRSTTSALIRTTIRYDTYTLPQGGAYSQTRRTVQQVELVDGDWTVGNAGSRVEMRPPSPCGHSMRVKPVKGTHNPDRKCDARCMGAVGPSCECACGGANHGRGHSSTQLPL